MTGGAADRFGRTELLLGAAAMERLRRARVTVAGLGAVGSYACEALARAGVGRLRLVDGDVVRASNINRQLFALGSTVGRPKAEVAAERVRDINPACEVEPLVVFLNRDTLEGALDPLPDVLVDAIDSLGPKAGLLAGAVSRGCRVVSSMGAAMRRDSTAVRVDDLWNTRHCPLARFLRKRLRRLGVSGPIRCVYSLEPVARHALAASDAAETDWRGRTRNTLGSVSYLTGLFGLLAAEAALEFLLNSQPQ